jgi:predicted Zn-dependent peptidase
MRHRSALLRLGFAVFLFLLVQGSVEAQEVPVIEYELENGMQLLMVPRPGDPNIAAGWIASVGSVYERPGITGVAHLFEHMMFKGTHTVGTTNIAEDLAIIEQLDQVKAKLTIEEAALLEAHRLGRIDDPNAPEDRSSQHRGLLQEFDDLLARQQEILVKEEFSRIYTEQGASGMNAGTSYDFTVYFINVPANKLELWFWMESDRLLNPVFREFYAERDVVHEERRLRTDSTPTGKFQEQFDAMFWGSSPYSWPVVGWPSDLEGMTRTEALDFFDTYYAPNNLVATLVGDFDPEHAVELAERYFGRIPRGVILPLEPRTREMPQLATKRMVAYADTNPQVAIRYHSVPDGHVDEPALVVLGQLLNGRTGRLYRTLVEEQQVATSASGGQSGFKFEGMFEIRGTARQGRSPEEVEQAIYAELDRLKTEPVEQRELQKVKNQNAASTYRDLRGNFQLMMQLLFRENNRGWETINTDPALYEAVTTDDIHRVANLYFTEENSAVAVYYRRDTEATDNHPALNGLDEEERQQARETMAAVAQLDAEQLQQFLIQSTQMVADVPVENKDLAEAMMTIIQERLDALGEER